MSYAEVYVLKSFNSLASSVKMVVIAIAKWFARTQFA